MLNYTCLHLDFKNYGDTSTQMNMYNVLEVIWCFAEGQIRRVSAERPLGPNLCLVKKV